MKESYNDIYMPCWFCPYGHNCKYYSDPVWDQWIANNQICPAYNYTYGSIYRAIENEKIKKEAYVSPLNVKS